MECRFLWALCFPECPVNVTVNITHCNVTCKHTRIFCPVVYKNSYAEAFTEYVELYGNKTAQRRCTSSMSIHAAVVALERLKETAY
jgi:hypothetical protein